MNREKPNKKLFEILLEFANIYNLLGDQYREGAYRTAAVFIESLDYALDNKTIKKFMTNKHPGIGPSIMNKIKDYIETGEIKKLQQLKNDPRIKASQIFSKILGVGPSTIKNWIAKGITSLDELKKAIKENKIKLNNTQILGLKYYDDLNERIPRNEITVIAHQLQQLFPNDSRFVVAGSYRRGLSTSGDVDILVSVTPEIFRAFEQKISNHKNSGKLIAIVSRGPERLTFLWKSGDHPDSKNMVRQVDILNLSPDHYWAGLLYFTGSWEFNEAMRSYAKGLGLRLNQNGLFRLDKLADKKIFALNYGKIPGTKISVASTYFIIPQSERDIFDALNLQYIEPQDRTGPEAIKPLGSSRRK